MKKETIPRNRQIELDLQIKILKNESAKLNQDYTRKTMVAKAAKDK